MVYMYHSFLIHSSADGHLDKCSDLVHREDPEGSGGEKLILTNLEAEKQIDEW